MAILKQLNGKAFFNVTDEELGKYAIPESKLAASLKEAGARLGTLATPEEVAKSGKKPVAPNEGTKAQAADAGAAYLYETQVVCPNCGSVRTVVVSSEVYNYYTCGNCGYTYRA